MTETKSSYKDNTAVLTLMICAMIFLMSVVVSVTLNQLNDKNNMAKNIESAISRGVDPISVKCAYEMTPSSTCIAYALNVKK